MSNQLFESIYENLSIPVLACRNVGVLPVVYMNKAAKLAFEPTYSVDKMRGTQFIKGLVEMLRFPQYEDIAEFEQLRTSTGQVSGFHTRVLSYQGDVLPVALFGNHTVVADREYFFLYILETGHSARYEESSYEILTRILGMVNHGADLDKTIDMILSIIGRHVKVGRVYVFEDVSEEYTSNTYEWCADGVPPAINELQMLRKADYQYDAIVKPGGMIITDDTAKLPEKDREILARQGIRAIAILPLFHLGKPLGYVGFDDCTRTRHWSRNEILLLEDTAKILSSLLTRRDAEQKTLLALQALRTVMDNLEEFIYISDPETYELKFVSEAMAKSMDKKAEELVGGPCWRIFGGDWCEPCEFCPLSLVRERGRAVWELHNSFTDKHYLVKNTRIKWIDGKDAHLATLVDISYRRRYEEQLELSASTDAMTNVYNRQWGFARLKEILAEPETVRENYTICFLDIDGLKKVNDQFGHAMGDELIINTINAIHASVRKNDVICRWGGDEFLLILNCNLYDAEKVVKNIEFAFNHFNSTQDKPYRLSVSFGLVSLTESSTDVDDLVSRADRLMYRNKALKHTRGSSRSLYRRPESRAEESSAGESLDQNVSS